MFICAIAEVQVILQTGFIKTWLVKPDDLVGDNFGGHGGKFWVADKELIQRGIVGNGGVVRGRVEGEWR